MADTCDENLVLKVTSNAYLVGEKICNFRTGDRRLNERAMSIGYVLSLDSAALSEVFSSGTALKRAYEFCQPKSGIFQR